MEPKKRVTIKDLASVCEVSTATVSRVLNHIPGNYSAETEQRILDAAKQMGYYPNRMPHEAFFREYLPKAKYIVRTGSMQHQIEQYHIKAANTDDGILTLSGGNQQKIVIAKWIGNKPEILLCDEPTRGIDVGAKAEVYSILRSIAAQGIGVVMVSSELPELLALCDRIIVMPSSTSPPERKITSLARRMRAASRSSAPRPASGASVTEAAPALRKAGSNQPRKRRLSPLAVPM